MVKKNLLCLLSFSFLLWFFLSAQIVWAVGLAVKPNQINLAENVNNQILSEFLVINISDEPALYQVYADELKEKIVLKPADFKLDPGQSQIVSLEAFINRPGTFSSNISIIARPLGAGGLSAASGMKLPVTIKISGIPFWWLVVAALSIICLAMIFGGLIFKRGKYKKYEIKN
ncbi:hypothetical protein HYZ76_02480 [Candidatus Falkowbacteria bacterium]|nr:hypothetical protein [Candidatus Falkowbacteria bacterium]